MAHKGFPQQRHVMDAMIDVSSDPRARQQMDPLTQILNKRENVEKYLKGLRVNFEIPNQPPTKRVYKVIGLSKPAAENFFEYDDPTTKQKRPISVYTYYMVEKKYQLQYPQWPCLQVQPKERNVHLPLEVSAS